MHLNFKRIWNIILAAELPALVCGLIAVFALQMVVANTENATKNEEKARLAIKSCSEAQKVLLRGIVSLVEFSETGQLSDLGPYYKSRDSLDKVIHLLDELSKSYPAEKPSIDKLEAVIHAYHGYAEEIVVLQKLGSRFAPARLGETRIDAEHGFELWGEASQQMTKDLERNLSLSPVSSQSHNVTMARVLIAALIAVFLACLITARFLSAYIYRRLSVVQENSKRLASGAALLPKMGGTDEIATLDREFHSMASAIAEARRREKEILENATDIIVTIDQQLIVRSANAASVRLWGANEKLEGKPFIDLAAHDARELLSRFFDQCRSKKEAGSVEVALSGTPEKNLYASVSAQWSEQNKLFSCVIHDITARKQAEDAVRSSEKRLRSMLEQMPAGMILCDSDGHILGCNALSTRLAGRLESDMLGATLSAALGLPPANGTDRDWLEAAAKSKHVLLPLGHSGSVTHLEISVERLTVEGTADYLLVLLDSTASQKLELLRHELIDGISKTIITPLNEINDVLTTLSLDAKQENNERLGQYIGTAVQESQRLLKLFSDLLEIEGSNIRQLSVRQRQCKVQELFKRSLEAVNVTAEKKGVRLSLEPTELSLYADPDRLVQVLINLVFNALKFTESGGYVKLEAQALDDGFVELHVKDSGCGIPEGLEEKIFEPYKQTKASDALAKGGSGLGLYICKSIIEKHGGSIGARNHADGALFFMKLPPQHAAPQTINISSKVLSES